MIRLAWHTRKPRLLRHCVRFASFQPAQCIISDKVYRDELQLEVASAMARRKPFLDPWAVQPKIVGAAPLEKRLETPTAWSEVANIEGAPETGAMVEFHNVENDNADLGIVVAPAQLRFNQHYNRCIVLTASNELTRVHPQDMTLVTSPVVDPSWVHSLQILPNRFDETHRGRLLLVDTVCHFWHHAHSFLVKDLAAVHANVCSEHHANAVFLSTVVKLLPRPAVSSRFDQAAYMYKVHLEMANDPARWMVPACTPWKQPSNTVYEHCTNDTPKRFCYFANPASSMEHLAAFLQSPEQGAAFVELARELTMEKRLYDDLVVHLSVLEKKHLHALAALKHAVLYPHPKLTALLLQSPRDIYSMLTEIGLYDNHKNPLTDIVLSAGLAGEALPSQLAAATPKDLRPSPLELASARMVASGFAEDKFPHLRTQRTYYKGHIVYALPSDGLHQLAVSIEKVNSRKYLVHIHVPDVAARIHPASTVFEEMARHRHSLSALRPLLDDDAIELLAKNMRQELSFKASAQQDFLSVGDTLAQREQPHQTCMTVSFEYHTYDASPLLDVSGRVSVSFDRLSNTQVKALDWTSLNEVLSGAFEPRILSNFRLFNRRKQPETIGLTEADSHDINLISSILQAHLMARNRMSATVAHEHELSISLRRKLRFSGEQLVTDVEAKAGGNAKAVAFCHEAKAFVGHLVSLFCAKESIPVFGLSQGLVETFEDDEVFVSHSNKLLPNFHGLSYFQTLMARDETGRVSLPAFLINSNYLARPSLGLAFEPHTQLGLPHGLVDVTDAMYSMASYWNQLQLLLHTHAKHAFQEKYFQLIRRFSHLRSLGYALHGPLDEQTLQCQLRKMQEAAAGARYIVGVHRRYWALKALEQSLDDFSATCIVTRKRGDKTLALCKEYGVEVEVEVWDDAAIGAVLQCDKVLYLDVASGMCVMRQQTPY